jgi:hypothetical protein
MNRSLSDLPALQVRLSSSSQMLGLVLPSNLTILLGAQKCLGPWPFGAQATPLSVATSTAVLAVCVVLNVHLITSPTNHTACRWFEGSARVARS